jgi:hypothetical protein
MLSPSNEILYSGEEEVVNVQDHNQGLTIVKFLVHVGINNTLVETQCFVFKKNTSYNDFFSLKIM